MKFGPAGGKVNSLGWYLIGVYLPAIAVYMLVASRSLSEYISTTFYVLLTVVSLIVLALIKSDDEYYQNLGIKNFLGAIILGFGMTLLSYLLSYSVFQNPDMLLSVNNWSSIPQSNSVVMLFLNTVLFGLVMAATSEELFRLPLFTEGKKRWGTTAKGVLIYVGFPVGFWAALHGIQAYTDPVMIIPAAVNGVLLTVYLWKTHCIFGCIFSHWLYNSEITFVTFLNGSAGVPSGTPFFPNLLDPAYWSNSGFILDGLLVAIVIWGFFFFLLPSLRKDDSKKRGRLK